MDPAAAAAAESTEAAHAPPCAPPPPPPPPPLSSEDSTLVSSALSCLAATSAAASAAFCSSLDAAAARDAKRLGASREAAKKAEDVARRALGEIDRLADEEQGKGKGAAAAAASDAAAASTSASSSPLLLLVSSASAALEEATQRLRDADAADVALLLARGQDLEELHSRAVEICCGKMRAERNGDGGNGENTSTSSSSSPSPSSSPLLLDVDSACRDLEEALRQSRRKIVLKYLSAIERANLRREAAERSLVAAAEAVATRKAPFAAQATAAAEHEATREIAELSRRVKVLQVQAEAASAAFSQRKKAAEKEAAALEAAAGENEGAAASAKEEAERNGKQLRTLRRENETAEAVESARLERLEKALESSAERGRAAEGARRVVAAALADEARKVRKEFFGFFFSFAFFERGREGGVTVFSLSLVFSLTRHHFLFFTDRGHEARGSASAEGGGRCGDGGSGERAEGERRRRRPRQRERVKKFDRFPPFLSLAVVANERSRKEQAFCSLSNGAPSSSKPTWAPPSLLLLLRPKPTPKSPPQQAAAARPASSSSRAQSPVPGRPRRWRSCARGTPTRRPGRGLRPVFGREEVCRSFFSVTEKRLGFFVLACLGRQRRGCCVNLHLGFRPFPPPKKTETRLFSFTATVQTSGAITGASPRTSSGLVFFWGEAIAGERKRERERRGEREGRGGQRREQEGTRRVRGERASFFFFPRRLSALAHNSSSPALSSHALSSRLRACFREARFARSHIERDQRHRGASSAKKLAPFIRSSHRRSPPDVK